MAERTHQHLKTEVVPNGIEVLYSATQISDRLDQLADMIVQKYEGENLLVVGIMKGAIMIVPDLGRKLHQRNLFVQYNYIRLGSYGSGTQAGNIILIDDIDKKEIEGRKILLVDAVADSGGTFDYAQRLLKSKNVESLETLTVVSKTARREFDIPIEYCGFTLDEDKFLLGYGADGNEIGRFYPFIGVKK